MTYSNEKGLLYWFVTNQGVRQGDNLSPTLFNIYINDLALELKKMNLGVTIGNLHVCILLYADDIVLISESEQNLQIMLDFVNSWCNKWQMKINNEKLSILEEKLYQKQVLNLKWVVIHLKLQTPIHT